MQLSASSSVDHGCCNRLRRTDVGGNHRGAVRWGGGAVYTSGLYESRDLDFVASASQRELEQVLNQLGFTREPAVISSTRHDPIRPNFPRGLWRSAARVHSGHMGNSCKNEVTVVVEWRRT